MKLTAEDIRLLKNKRIVSMLTCYDTAMARILDEASLDIILVGDSLGEVLYGMHGTAAVTMEMMIRHTQAVRRGLVKTHLMADMPCGAYDDAQTALKNARLLIEAGGDSVKLENPSSEVVKALRAEGIEVCGHAGLTPQSMPDYKLQGKDEVSASKIFADAMKLQSAGCFCLLLECVEKNLAERITKEAVVPVIGIAAGFKLDGQVLVINDLLGMDRIERRYVKKRADLHSIIKEAAEKFAEDTRSGN